MATEKHKLPIIILSLCLIGLIGFKDTGIFVKDFISIDKNQSKISFEKYEEINVFRENAEGYLIEKNSVVYDIPMDTMIRTSRSTERYSVLNDTSILDKPIMGNSLKILNKGDIVEILSYDESYGMFRAEDGTEGYIKFSDVEVIIEDNISYGISVVDKIIKNKDSYYTLVKGEPVLIKDFKDSHYIIVDKEGKEFKVNDVYIELSRARDKANRGNNLNVPNRGELVTKVVTAAYNNLGKSYRAGGIGPHSFDCSGLTYSIYLNELDIKLERVSSKQTNNGVAIARENLIPGDIVFFRTSGKQIGHVGLYIGENNMIHASSGQNKVMVTNINDSNYYNTRYMTGRRIIK